MVTLVASETTETTEAYVPPNQLYSVPVAELLPDPNQPRKYFDSKSQHYISETLSLARLPQEIRDECRTDPAVPKKTLLTIAKGKQQQGMLTAYRQYMDRLNAQKKPRPLVAKATEAESSVKNLAPTESRLARLDLRTLSAADKDSVVRAAEALMVCLRTFLENAATPASTAASQPTAATKTTAKTKPKTTSKTASSTKKKTVKKTA